MGVGPLGQLVDRAAPAPRRAAAARRAGRPRSRARARCGRRAAARARCAGSHRARRSDRSGRGGSAFHGIPYITASMTTANRASPAPGLRTLPLTDSTIVVEPARSRSARSRRAAAALGLWGCGRGADRTPHPARPFRPGAGLACCSAALSSAASAPHAAGDLPLGRGPCPFCGTRQTARTCRQDISPAPPRALLILRPELRSGSAGLERCRLLHHAAFCTAGWRFDRKSGRAPEPSTAVTTRLSGGPVLAFSARRRTPSSGSNPVVRSPSCAFPAFPSCSPRLPS